MKISFDQTDKFKIHDGVEEEIKGEIPYKRQKIDNVKEVSAVTSEIEDHPK